MAVVMNNHRQEFLMAQKFPLPSLIRIRPAKLEDLEELGKLWLYQRQYHEQWDDLYVTNTTAQKTWIEQILVAIEKPNHCILVAEKDLGEVVGYIHGSFYPWPFSPKEYYGSLNTIVIAAEFQGQGIGKKLVQILLQWFRYHHIEHISVHVDYRNQRALKLYQQVGFRAYQHHLMLDITN
ncbi:MAG: GNAT family N-acetyltransferase [Candidatus Hodarchaeota archaeon]